MSEKKPDSERMRDINPTGIRLPADLKQKLVETAASNRWSLNTEVIVRLIASFRKSSDKYTEDPDLFIASFKIDGKKQWEGETIARIIDALGGIDATNISVRTPTVGYRPPKPPPED